MSWWGKVIGGALGFMVGGPLGALFGVYAGHSFDRGMHQDFGFARGLPRGDQERMQASFFTATFAVMGHIAKSDGKVSPEEIRVAGQIMDEMGLNAEMRDAAKELFNRGKQADFEINAVLQQLRQELFGQTNVLQMFLEIQIRAAAADGRLDSSEKRVLHSVAAAIGVNEYVLESLLGRYFGEHRFQQSPGGSQHQLQAAYQILNLAADCSESELKHAYRKLMAQHHPDKLVAKGLPEEMMKIAKEKTQEIKAAYELISRQRKHQD